VRNVTIYELELKESLIDLIQTQFGIYNEKDIIPYFIIREKILTKKKTRKTDIHSFPYIALGSFILKELSVHIDDNNCFYMNNIAFPSSALIGSDLKAILDDWIFQSNMFYNNVLTYAQKEYEIIIKAAKSETKIPKQEQIFHDTAQTLNALNRLNEKFSVVQGDKKSNHIKLNSESTFELSEEERLSRLYLSYQDDYNKRQNVSEDTLEEYLIRHPIIIDPTLKIIDHQVIIPEGRIDILGKNNDDKHAIVEVKIEKDTDIVWQRLHYVSEWEKKHPDTSFIIVTTEPLSESIKTSLSKVGETTVLEVTPIVKRNQIKDISVNSRYVLSGDKE